MKTLTLTSHSSTISSATSSDPTDRSEPRDNNNNSCYFPGCRKDANCTCEICVASINATLDLIPSTARSKISNPNLKSGLKSPIPYNSKVLSTPNRKKPIPTLENSPNSTARVSLLDNERREEKGFGFGGFLIWFGFYRVLSIPRLKKPEPTSRNKRNSTKKATFCDKGKREKRVLGFGGFLIRLILVVGLVLGVELGIDLGVSRFLKPELSGETVINMSGNARVLEDLSGKLGSLQTELRGLVSGEVSDCGSDGSLWKIKQGDMLLNSQCILYKSATEEVSIWGWPLQTAGLLTADFSSRSLTILSGRVTEWSFGKVSNFTMEPNQSWIQQKWSASVVQLDPNTWIIEYKRARMVENPRLISTAMEFLSFWFSREISRIKQDFWFLPDLGSMYDGFKGESFNVPT